MRATWGARGVVRTPAALAVWVGLGLGCSYGALPVTGRPGCVNHVDCLGGEQCDAPTGRCVPGGRLDAGGCAAAPVGCADDGLRNHSAVCATPVTEPGWYRADLAVCPAAVDHFSVATARDHHLQVGVWAADWTGLRVGLASAEEDGGVATGARDGGAVLMRRDAPWNGTPILSIQGGAATAYAVKTWSGPRCALDTDCDGGRCEVLALALQADPPPAADLARPGICMPDRPSACGDAVLEPNRRPGSVRLVGGAPALALSTCLDDVDWLALGVAGLAGHAELTLACTSAAVGYAVELSIHGSRGQPLWAGMHGAGAATPLEVRVPFLPGESQGGGLGVLQVRLQQLGGLGAGQCSIQLRVVPATCQSDSACQGEPEAVRFQRTRCVTGACSQP